MAEGYKKFCVVQFKKLPPGLTNDHQCLPSSWIRCEHEPNQVTVGYPLEITNQIKKYLRSGKPALTKWPLYSAVVKWQVDSYSEWQQVASAFGQTHFLQPFSSRNVERLSDQQNEQRNQEDVLVPITTLNEIEIAQSSTPKPLNKSLNAIETPAVRNNSDGWNVSSQSTSSNATGTPVARKRHVLFDDSTKYDADAKSSPKIKKRSTLGESSHSIIDIGDISFENSAVELVRAHEQIPEASSSMRETGLEGQSTPVPKKNVNKSATSSTAIQKQTSIGQYDEHLLRQFSEACEAFKRLNLLLKIISEKLGKPSPVK